MEKSVIILSNFWDANSVIEQGYIIYPIDEDRIYKINFYVDAKNGSNYSAHSIALSHPDLTKLEHLSSMTRLDIFCPTYDMLHRYKDDGNWAAYTKDYISLLKSRRRRMTDWVSSLALEKVYFLCCWENTALKAHCHREILYKAMRESKVIGDKALVVYRNGNEIKRKNYNSISPNGALFGHSARPIITESPRRPARDLTPNDVF